MQFKNLVLASFVALSLVACGGSDDDNPSNPGGNNPSQPGGNTGPGSADAPSVGGSFTDNSSINQTDKLRNTIVGSSFYVKAEHSQIDAKYTKTRISSVADFSSVDELNDETYNPDFIAYAAASPDRMADTKSRLHAAFDGIGIENQKEGKNNIYFPQGDDSKSWVSAAKYKVADIAALPIMRTAWMKNSENIYDFRDDKTGSADPKAVDTFNGWTIFKHQEEDRKTPKTNISGNSYVRLYGLNAWLEETTNTDLTMPDRTSGGSLTKSAYLVNNYLTQGKQYFEQKFTNFVWFDLHRARTTEAKKVGTGIKSAFELVTDARNYPTYVDYGVLTNVQFGRISGKLTGLDAQKLPPLPSVNKAGMPSKPWFRNYPYYKDGVNSTIIPTSPAVLSEDFYFARGIGPTNPQVVATLPNAQYEYNGNAVAFGIDNTFTRTKKGDGKQTKYTDSTNSPGIPITKGDGFILTPMDGVGSLVSFIYKPATGTLEGQLYNVWAGAKFFVDNKGDILDLADDGKGGVKAGSSAKGVSNFDGYETDGGDLMVKNSVALWRQIDRKVLFQGKLIPGSNTFHGDAIREVSNNRGQREMGVFTAQLFGADGNELAGTFSSQLIPDTKLSEQVDPNMFWGGAFGAQRPAAEPAGPLDYNLEIYGGDGPKSFDSAFEGVHR